MYTKKRPDVTAFQNKIFNRSSSGIKQHTKLNDIFDDKLQSSNIDIKMQYYKNIEKATRPTNIVRINKKMISS